MSSDTNFTHEAERIVTTANNRGVTLRLIGGLAIRFHCHGPHSAHLRVYHDIDVFGLTKELKGIYSAFEELGYAPNFWYNSKAGAMRLQFVRADSSNHVDVFLDKFRMDHTLDFRKRLLLDSLTIPVTDLLLTKLQIMKLDPKDFKDIVAILEDHETKRNDDREALNVDYIAELCSHDWGLDKTIIDNLAKIVKFVEEQPFELQDRPALLDKMKLIHESIKTKNKTLMWRLRDVVGERVRWYDVIETGEGEA
jgi:hypothetical protein